MDAVSRVLSTRDSGAACEWSCFVPWHFSVECRSPAHSSGRPTLIRAEIIRVMPRAIPDITVTRDITPLPRYGGHQFRDTIPLPNLLPAHPLQPATRSRSRLPPPPQSARPANRMPRNPRAPRPHPFPLPRSRSSRVRTIPFPPGVPRPSLCLPKWLRSRHRGRRRSILPTNLLTCWRKRATGLPVRFMTGLAVWATIRFLGN